MKTTYLLSGPRQASKLKKLAEKAVWSFVYRERAVMVFNGSEKPPEAMVVKTIAGDQGEVHESWARRTVLEELQAEHMLRKTPVSSQQRAAAVKKYAKIRKQKEAAEAAKDKAEADLCDAAKDLVRTFGRGPIVIGDETLDVTYRGETVYYIRRKGMG